MKHECWKGVREASQDCMQALNVTGSKRKTFLLFTDETKPNRAYNFGRIPGAALPTFSRKSHTHQNFANFEGNSFSLTRKFPVFKISHTQNSLLTIFHSHSTAIFVFFSPRRHFLSAFRWRKIAIPWILDFIWWLDTAMNWIIQWICRCSQPERPKHPFFTKESCAHSADKGGWKFVFIPSLLPPPPKNELYPIFCERNIRKFLDRTCTVSQFSNFSRGLSSAFSFSRDFLLLG